MKPYKIIQSQNPTLKAKKLIGPLVAPKPPLAFFIKVHTPPKRKRFNSPAESLEDH